MRKPEQVMIDGRPIPFTNNAKVLGLTIGTTGLDTHIKQRIQMAKVQQIKFKRFKKLTAKTQLYLYQTLVRPWLEYTAVPLCISSETNKKQMQVVQNRTFKQIIRKGFEDPNLTMKKLHQKI